MVKNDMKLHTVYIGRLKHACTCMKKKFLKFVCRLMGNPYWFCILILDIF